jgi:TfoX/Sxy family transcriptional regulator of competence genes
MAALEALLAHLEGAAAGLPEVTKKRMFGCDGLFAKGNIFGLVWKHGRIGVRLPDTRLFDELMAKKGAVPWKAGPMTMSHWVLVPEEFHADGRSLAKWVKDAHRLALAAPASKSPKAAKKKAAPKKVAAKKAAPKKAAAAKKKRR